LDLSKEFAGGNTEGVYHLRGGEIGYTYAIPNADGTFDVRYESGWHSTYKNDGTRPVAGTVIHKDGSTEPVPGGSRRDIVKFELMTWREASAKYPGIAGGFSP
jgi:hypothetical protein